MAFGQPRIEYKTNAQMRTMHEAGLVLSRALDAAVAAAAPGVTTARLDDVFAAVLQDAGAKSNFLGYHGFPATICTSVNEEVVHGIPGGRVLADGDIISIDGGAIVDGWHSDSARTVIVGTADPEDVRLSEVTEEAMWRGIAALATGKFVGDIGNAVDDYVSSVPGKPLGILEDYVGPRNRLRDAHGPGRAELPHRPPRAEDPPGAVPRNRAHAGPRQHRDRHPGRRLDRRHHRRQALLPVGALRRRAREGDLGPLGAGRGSGETGAARRRARPDSLGPNYKATRGFSGDAQNPWRRKTHSARDFACRGSAGAHNGAMGATGAITDVAGIRVGHVQKSGDGWLSGVTVVLPPPGTVGSVDVRGGGPATHETDALDPTTLSQTVDAVVLTGGSAFGLAAAGGASAGARRTAEASRSPAGLFRSCRRPRSSTWAAAAISPPAPDEAMGYAATAAAAGQPEGHDVERGNVGAGTGAAIGRGPYKGGVGTASLTLETSPRRAGGGRSHSGSQRAGATFWHIAVRGNPAACV